MSFVPRATLTVACAAAAAALATTSTAAETWPSGGASLTAGTARPTIAPALPAPAYTKFSGSTAPSGGVALLALAHISARLAPPRSGPHKTWTVRVDGRRLTFNQLAPR